jgi:hypothetical protein
MDALAKETASALALAAEAMKRGYDRKHQAALPLAVGDLVLLEAKGLETMHPSKKLDDKRYGPFPITEIVGIQSYRLRLPSSWKIHDVFHTSKLTPYVTPKFPSQTDPIIVPDLANTSAVLQSIIDHHKLRKKTLYLVLLQNQDPEDATWISRETLSTFLDPLSIVASYHHNFPSLLGGG